MCSAYAPKTRLNPIFEAIKFDWKTKLEGQSSAQAFRIHIESRVQTFFFVQPNLTLSVADSKAQTRDLLVI